jgi:hypothetical protein
MNYPRRLGTRVRHLFRRARAHEPHFAPQVMRTAALAGAQPDMRLNLVKHTCDWCLERFIMPDENSRANFVSMPGQTFRLDIGGFCFRCREFRCHQGSIWVDARADDKGEVVLREWGCDVCGTPYTVDSVEAARRYISPATRKALVDSLAKILAGVGAAGKGK